MNGTTGTGTVYRLTLTGEFTLLHTFDGQDDGVGPNNLIQGKDGNLYGTTAQGGANNAGTVFRITPDGKFTSLYAFTGSPSSATPVGLVQGSDGNLYGTTTYGGVKRADTGGFTGSGTAFRLTTAGAFTILPTVAVPRPAFSSKEGTATSTARLPGYEIVSLGARSRRSR